MDALPQSKPMTAEEFLAWAAEHDVRAELVDGQVHAMAPERAAHLRVKFRAAKALDAAVTRLGLPCEVFPDGMTVVVAEGTVYEPDAVLRCGPPLPAEATSMTDPIVLVEVLSPATQARDTGDKLADYFRLPSLRHYLILRPGRNIVIHHARAADGAIATRILHEGSLILDPPGITLDLAEFFPPAG